MLLWFLISMMGIFCETADRLGSRSLAHSNAYQHAPYSFMALQIARTLPEHVALQQGILVSPRLNVVSDDAILSNVHMAAWFGCPLPIDEALRRLVVSVFAIRQRIATLVTINTSMMDAEKVEIEQLVASLSDQQRLVMFNAYDKTGQTVAHKMTRFHWDMSLLQFFIDNGLDVTKPTIAPDRHIGSTLAHNVAGMLTRDCFGGWLIKEMQDQRRQNAVDCLKMLWKVDQGQHFNMKSGRQASTVWEVMPWHILNSEFVTLYEKRDVKN